MFSRDIDRDNYIVMKPLCQNALIVNIPHNRKTLINSLIKRNINAPVISEIRPNFDAKAVALNFMRIFIDEDKLY